MRKILFMVAIIAIIGISAGCASSDQPVAPTETPVSTSNASAVTFAAVQVTKDILPSVVNIVTESVEMGMFLQQVPVEGAGTGIIYDTNGYIVTNNHVVEGAKTITVNLPDGRSFDGKLVGGDVYTDLAVVKIEATDLTPAVLGDSSVIEVGEPVLAVGHAFNLPGGPTVTEGVISARERDITESSSVTLVHVIQTDAAINPGNSGGPLVNMDAQVIGINTAELSSGVGLGFAIAINEARPIILDLIEFGHVQRASLGIQAIDDTPSLAYQYGLAVSEGVVVVDVTPDSPAATIGLEPGDVIVKIGESDLTNTSELAQVLQAYKTGDMADLVYYRGNDLITVQVTFQEAQ